MYLFKSLHAATELGLHGLISQSQSRGDEGACRGAVGGSGLVDASYTPHSTCIYVQYMYMFDMYMYMFDMYMYNVYNYCVKVFICVLCTSPGVAILRKR